MYVADPLDPGKLLFSAILGLFVTILVYPGKGGNLGEFLLAWALITYGIYTGNIIINP